MDVLNIVLVSALVVLLTLNDETVANPVCVYWCSVPVYFYPSYDPEPAIPEEPTTLPAILPTIPSSLPIQLPANLTDELPQETPELPAGVPMLRLTRNSPIDLTQLQRRQYSVSIGYAQPAYAYDFPGYQTIQGFGTYKVHRHGAPWHEALRACAAEGTTLAVIMSPAEADVIKAMFDPAVQHPGAINNMHFWVGAQERGVHGQFYTVFGDRLESSGFNVWSPIMNQPNDFGNTDCVSIFQDGTYFDGVCTSKFAFVCKKLA